MTTDPHATRKIETCASVAELRGLLDGWRSRGVVLSAEDERVLDQTMEQLVRAEGRR